MPAEAEQKRSVFSPKQAFAECLLEKTDPSKKNCLLGCSGSVATLKIPELAVAMYKKGYNVLIVCSGRAKFFLDKAEAYNPAAWAEFLDMGGFDMLLQDADEWGMWEKIGSVVLHIELRKWADVFVVAPASASLLGKAMVGISDSLVLSVMRAWDFNKPCFVCPAMNTMMWDHPVTEETLEKLRAWGWRVIDPVDKVLACMEAGMGAMASVASIVEQVASPGPRPKPKPTPKPQPQPFVSPCGSTWTWSEAFMWVGVGCGATLAGGFVLLAALVIAEGSHPYYVEV